MFRLQRGSELPGRAKNDCRFSLYYKIGETSNIHSRAKLLWTLTLAPIIGKIRQQRSAGLLLDRLDLQA